jgi:hypothetical protein
MRTRMAALVAAAVLLSWTAWASEWGLDYLKYTSDGRFVPDFSQHYGPNWNNFCAPTVAADCVYYFGASGYPSLLQNNPWGPDMNWPAGPADLGACSIIAGVNAPPAIAGSLAAWMGTTVNGGTTAVNMTNGLDTYLETNDGVAGNANWTTTLKLNTDPGVTGQALWDYMKDELHACEDVLPLIHWKNGPPEPGSDYQYDQPDNGNPMDHAVMMVGFDDRNANNEFIYVNDPANNIVGGGQWRAVHNWNGEYAKYGVTITATTVDITLAGATASIYGVVTASPVPEPSSLLLVLAGVLVALRQRR